MEKKIEDYLHLYMGCDVIGYKIIKDESTGDIHTIELPKKLAGILNSEYYLSGNVQAHNFKLLLRPLSDITEEEERVSISLGSNMGTPEQAAMAMAEWTRFMLSKSFDIFGLIEAGLAIDKTTLDK